MNILQTTTASLIAGGLALGGIPTGDEAGRIQYWYGPSIQNQIHGSQTRFMTGGYAAFIEGGSVPFVHITVSGHGTSEGPGETAISGFALTTHQYCQWRWGLRDPGNYGLKCYYDN